MILLSGTAPNGYGSFKSEQFNSSTGIQDTLDRQKLYNGRAWRNLYSRVQGDQFLFVKDFLQGTVTIDNRLFKGMPIKYDVYNDEIITITDLGIILQLNKELVDRFSLNYGNLTYQFQRIDPDSLNNLSGYVNVLYNGGVSLFVKYRKEILLLAVDHKFDLFNQFQKIYLRKDGKIFLVSGRRDFLKILEDKKEQVKSFIKSNRITISKKEPGSFVMAIEYYDSLKH